MGDDTLGKSRFQCFKLRCLLGYCGADIKAVCAEAALCALRRRYPQIYASSQKLQLDVASISVGARDFVSAMRKMVPASQRAVASPAKALAHIVQPLLAASLDGILGVVQKVFPHAELGLRKNRDRGGDANTHTHTHSLTLTHTHTHTHSHSHTFK